MQYERVIVRGDRYKAIAEQACQKVLVLIEDLAHLRTSREPTNHVGMDTEQQEILVHCIPATPLNQADRPTFITETSYIWSANIFPSSEHTHTASAFAHRIPHALEQLID
jgi:hypothetical protein